MQLRKLLPAESLRQKNFGTPNHSHSTLEIKQENETMQESKWEMLEMHCVPWAFVTSVAHKSVIGNKEK